MPLDAVSYSLAKKAHSLARSHASRHESGGEDPITGWISPSQIGPSSDSPAEINFRTKNIIGNTPVNHAFCPTDDSHGYLGKSDKRWYYLYADYVDARQSLGSATLYITGLATANRYRISGATTDPAENLTLGWNASLNRLRFRIDSTTVKSIAWLDDVAGAESAWVQLVNFGGIFWFNNNWSPSGLLYSGTGGSGSISWLPENLRLGTGTTASSFAYAWKLVGLSPQPTWDKTRYFVCNTRFLYLNADAYAWVIMGRADYDSGSSDEKHVGFKVVNGSLYGTVADGTLESTLSLGTIGSSEVHELKVVFTPSVEARFYVDGEDKGAITTHLPSGTVYANQIFYASVYNTAASNKT